MATVYLKLQHTIEKLYTLNRWRWGFRLLAVVLGLLHLWAAITNYSMNADGISYMDIGEAFWQGDWSLAVNAVWSPLYAWLLGLVLHLFQPGMRWEFALVQGVNFALYLGAMGCWEWFWQEVRRSQPTPGWPDWVWWGLGYGLFIWSALGLIELWAVTPDMLMAGLVYIAAALLVRGRYQQRGWGAAGLLGLLLGLAYLSKAIMFPVAFLFLGLSLFGQGTWRHNVTHTLLSAFCFLLISGSWIGVISTMRGRVTFSDAGTITYVRYVYGLPYPHWQGGPAPLGQPLHPSRQVHQDPPVYIFAQPVGGTYPISTDPFYWYEGVQTPFNPGAQLRLFLASLLFYFDLFGRQSGVLVALTLFWIGVTGPRYPHLTDWLRRHGFILLAAAALGLYALVYVEERYVAVFLVLLWADGWTLVRPPELPARRTWLPITGGAMILFLLLQIMAFNLEGAGVLANRQPDPLVTPRRGPTWPGEVAEALYQVGVQPGDSVGLIGYGFEAFWARLARVKIVGEMFEWQAASFWLGDEPFQAEVLHHFAAAGAKAVVAEYVPPYAHLPGWQQVGHTDFYIYLLTE